MKRFKCVGLAIAAAAIATSLAACAGKADAGYKRVSISYDYSAADKSIQEWRAFMRALDSCHFSGYQDAELAKAPTQQCKTGSPAGCAVTHVATDYDCYGMGYQTSS
jgi:hypothetical protein